MFWMIAMLLLIVIAGWLDSRLNWRDAQMPEQAQETLRRKESWQ
jgi:hypothetical protein